MAKDRQGFVHCQQDMVGSEKMDEDPQKKKENNIFQCDNNIPYLVRFEANLLSSRFLALIRSLLSS